MRENHNHKLYDNVHDSTEIEELVKVDEMIKQMQN